MLVSSGRFVGIHMILLSHTLVIDSLQNRYCQLSCNVNNKITTHTVCERQNIKCGPDPACGPGFQTPRMTEQLRKLTVDLHNWLRNRVAIGDETRGGHQPPAANMKMMRYNKELEFIAQCWANKCNGNPLTHDRCRRTAEFEHVGQNLGFVNSSDPIRDLPKIIQELTLKWYDEVAIFKRDWVRKTTIRPGFVVGHYTQMLWADTDEVGCALSMYTSENGKFHHVLLVCNYAPGGNYLGKPIYVEGDPASKCPATYVAHPLYWGLCDPAPPTSTTIKKL